jgi:hypothetical protein
MLFCERVATRAGRKVYLTNNVDGFVLPLLQETFGQILGTTRLAFLPVRSASWQN